MTQDFAKIKPEPILEKKIVEPSPAWLLMVTGLLVGVTMGVFACVLFYLSGNVPPLNIDQQPQIATTETISMRSADQTNTPGLDFEFYTELPKYEVQTDAVPVEIPEDAPIHPTNEAAGELAIDRLTLANFMLQTGAFQQQESAKREMQRQVELGLNVIVKLAELPGKTLYLVQVGPYSSATELEKARQLLRRNNIATMTIQLQ